jgi:rod shape-determining protein MreD
MDRLPGIRPRPNIWQRIDAAGRAAFPIVSTAAGLLVLSTPLGLPGQSALRPALALACVYFWTLYRPASMSPVAGFMLGLLTDLLGQAPIGIGMVALLAAQGIALRWRRVLIRQEFLAEWIFFCGVALLFGAVIWALDSVFAFTLLPPSPVLFQAALAAGCYPLLALFLLVAHRGFADPEQA